MKLKFVQVALLNELIEEGEAGDNNIDVPIKGAVNLKSHPIKDFDVCLSYGDLKLIVAMLRDYVKSLDEVKSDDINWVVYYRKKFLEMSENISKQIDYDYDEHLKKCLKKAEKEKDSDIGGEALMLALKRGAAKTKPVEEANPQPEAAQEQAS